MRFLLLGALLSLVACSSLQPNIDRRPDAEDEEVHNHPEAGVPLPFDPIYCDNNENGNVDPDEISPDNICPSLGNAQQFFSEKPIASFGLKKGELILTVDDGPNEKVTRPLLDVLDEYNIKVTFFIVGNRISSNRALINEMIRRGHTIGNHTYSHDISRINANTITGEILQSYQALTAALGHEPTGRILFRAPGLGWSAPKAIALNANETTYNFIGPIHANLGTDAPRADWSCWSQGVSAQQCAEWYYQDIMNAGRGVILSHDIFYREGRGNTFEMLRTLLKLLETQGGGITNKHPGTGVWTFVSLPETHVLDQFDKPRSHSSTN